MTQIVFISDTHNVASDLPIPDGDILIHCGDLTSRGTIPEIAKFSSWFAALPHKHKIFIAGNHDFGFEKEAELAYRVASCGVYLRDSVTVAEGIRIYGSPWQPWFHDWAFNLHRGSPIKEKWDLIPSDTEILVTHGPPKGILDRTARGEEVGCEELALAVERIAPKIHAFGHIHEAYGTQVRTWASGRETLFINACMCDLRYRAIQPAICVRVDRDESGCLCVLGM